MMTTSLKFLSFICIFMGLNSALAQTNDYVSTDGNSANQDHLLTGALKTFFQVYGGYEQLNKTLANSNGLMRGFISVKGSVTHLYKAGAVAGNDFVFVPFELKATTDQKYTLQIAAMEKNFVLSGNQEVNKNDLTGTTSLRLNVGTFNLDTTKPWGQTKSIEVIRATPMFSETGHRINFSFGLPIETGAIWSNIDGFLVDGQVNPTHDNMQLHTWQTQVYVAAKFDARLSERTRISGIYQISAYTHAPTTLNSRTENGKKIANYSDWDYYTTEIDNDVLLPGRTGILGTYEAPSMEDGIPVDAYAPKKMNTNYYEQALKNSSLEVFYGISFGKKRNHEIQFVLKGIFRPNQSIAVSKSDLVGPANPALAGKQYWWAWDGTKSENWVIATVNGQVGQYYVGPINPMPAVRLPSQYENKKISIPNPSEIQFGVRIKL